MSFLAVQAQPQIVHCVGLRPHYEADLQHHFSALVAVVSLHRVGQQVIWKVTVHGFAHRCAG